MHGMRIAALEFFRGGAEALKWLESRKSGAEALKFSNRNFSSDIANQRVLREGATTESTQGGIKATAAGVIGSGNFCRNVIGARVEMNADLDRTIDRVEDGSDQSGNLLWRGETDGVGEGNLRDAGVREEVAGGNNLVEAPRVIVGIAEGHRDVDDEGEAGLEGGLPDGVESLDGFLGSLVLIAAQKLRGDGVGKSEGGDSVGFNSTDRAFLIDDDADDLNVSGWIEEGEGLFGIGHLRNDFGGDERDGVNVGEAGSDQGAKVIRFNLGRDGPGESLPCIAGTLDEFDGVGHWKGYRVQRAGSASKRWVGRSAVSSKPAQREVGTEQDAVGDESEDGEVSPAREQEGGDEKGGSRQGDGGVPARDPLVNRELEGEQVVPRGSRREMENK